MARSGPGRRGGTDAARFLVALVGGLEKPGDTLRVDVIAKRFSISEKDARKYLEIIEQAYVDDGQYLPVYVEDDGITLQYEFGLAGRPIRLTSSEAAALIAAMETADVPDDSAIRAVVENSFVRPTMDVDEVERTLSSAFDAAEGPLAMCVAALVEGTRISFFYHGSSGERMRRTVDPLHVHQSEGLWYLDAFDLDRAAERTFRIDKMEELEQVGPAEQHPLGRSENRMVELVFSDPEYFKLLDWPQARVVDEGAELRVSLPYFEGDWLVRRMTACAGTVRSDDEELNARVVEYANRLLNG